MKIIISTLNIISVLLCLYGYTFTNINICAYGVLILITSFFVYSLMNNSTRRLLTIFLISFFTFLLGKISYDLIILNQLSFESYFSEKVLIDSLIILAISIYSLWIGFIVSEHFVKSKKVGLIHIELNNSKRNCMILSSKFLYFVTLIPAVYSIISAINYTRMNGYLALYNSYRGSNLIIDRLADMNQIAFLLYLSCFPKKNSSKLLLFTFICLQILNILTGRRGETIANLLLLFFYFMSRSDIILTLRGKNIEKNWMNKGKYLWIVAFTPILLVLLNIVSIVRRDAVIKGNFWQLLFSFFDQQGVSFNVIAHSVALKDTLANMNSNYFFGPIIIFLRNNIITRVIFGIEPLIPQTVEMAMNGNLLSESLSFLVMPSTYLNGGGIGNSYISELYVDFGILGIVIFNFLLGGILCAISIQSSTKPWWGAIRLLVISSILLMPRSSSLNFVVSFINITTILTFGLFYIIYLFLIQYVQKLSGVNK
ncbi:O-antigen polysaccharide polymerase Wzy family protein [Aerococcus tenax]|uniref:O-antigen polysaccharide polymerase Wzy family protein n=1 Tax=Aerococcus tenax TaxID=3078812 RepID=UPI0018A75694|nr:O-antigen polysaccharide polymerase Wzy family protein [Aerococcus tenax]